MALKKQHKTRQPEGSKCFFWLFFLAGGQEPKKASAACRLETRWNGTKRHKDGLNTDRDIDYSQTMKWPYLKFRLGTYVPPLRTATPLWELGKNPGKVVGWWLQKLYCTPEPNFSSSIPPPMNLIRVLSCILSPTGDKDLTTSQQMPWVSIGVVHFRVCVLVYEGKI